jgi:bifunctional DNase/RNase
MEIEMTIKGLMIDPITNMPIVILKDKEGNRVLPIWVGIFEANAIALQIENITTPRPMTKEVLKNVMGELEGNVEKIGVFGQYLLRHDLFEKGRRNPCRGLAAQ